MRTAVLVGTYSTICNIVNFLQPYVMLILLSMVSNNGYFHSQGHERMNLAPSPLSFVSFFFELNSMGQTVDQLASSLAASAVSSGVAQARVDSARAKPGMHVVVWLCCVMADGRVTSLCMVET